MGDKLVWPSVCDVEQYRHDVRDAILNLIDTKPMETPVTQDSPWVSTDIHRMLIDVQLYYFNVLFLYNLINANPVSGRFLWEWNMKG